MTATPTTETWVYAGRRDAGKGKIVHAWVTLHDEGREVLFEKKITGHTVGGLYDIAVTRDDGRVTVHGTPTFTLEPAEPAASDLATLDAMRGWAAEDRAAYQLVEARKAERAAAKNDELDAALEVLRRYHDRLTYAKRAAFRQWVDGEVSRPPTPER